MTTLNSICKRMGITVDKWHLARKEVVMNVKKLQEWKQECHGIVNSMLAKLNELPLVAPEPETATEHYYRVYMPAKSLNPSAYKAKSPDALANWLTGESKCTYAGRTIRIIDSKCGNEYEYVAAYDIDTGKFNAVRTSG